MRKISIQARTMVRADRQVQGGVVPWHYQWRWRWQARMSRDA